VDAVLLTGYFGGYGHEAELEAARGLIRASVASPVPLVVQTMYRDSAVARELRASGVPVYGEIESAARALARMREHAEARLRPRRVPELPEPVPGAAAEGYWEARELVGRAGIELAPARPARSLAEARTAAAELGYPVVLKALGLLHKSDAGGVVLGIENEAALTSSFADIAGRLGPEEYAVERMAALAEGVEVIVGVRRDRRFGPIVVVGLGGVYAEIFRDAAVALAPIDEDEAEDLLRSLRGAPLLTGARGRPPLAVGAAARVAARLSQLAAAHPDLDEIEINPLLVRAGDALGLDALIIASARGG
jgi:acyl-CoA synthetase (NDP forming)